jgi:hypothetical protein
VAVQQNADCLLYRAGAMSCDDPHGNRAACPLSEQERIRTAHRLGNAQPVQIQDRLAGVRQRTFTLLQSAVVTLFWSQYHLPSNEPCGPQ